MSAPIGLLQDDETYLRHLVRGVRPNLLKNKRIHVTGDGPFSWEYMRIVVTSCGAKCVNPYALPYWTGILDDLNLAVPEDEIVGLKEGKEYLQSLRYVVLGRENYYKDFLEATLQYAREYYLMYLSQEDFIELLKYGSVYEYFQGDGRIQNHSALKFLTTIGFDWPDTEPYLHCLRNYSSDLAEVSKLGMMGYSTKLDVTTRRTILKHAVKRYGLRDISEFIAWRIRLTKGRLRNADVRDTIDIYTNDLLWLKHTYYHNSRFDFYWPDY